MTTTKFNPKARANEIAAQLKAAEKAQAEYEATITEAVKQAGRTRVEFVEMLYAHFDIKSETTERKDSEGHPVKDKSGSPVLVRTDKDEAKRIVKLADAFEALIDSTTSPTSKTEAATAGSIPAKPAAATTDQFGKRNQ